MTQIFTIVDRNHKGDEGNATAIALALRENLGQGQLKINELDVSEVDGLEKMSA